MRKITDYLGRSEWERGVWYPVHMAVNAIATLPNESELMAETNGQVYYVTYQDDGVRLRYADYDTVRYIHLTELPKNERLTLLDGDLYAPPPPSVAARPGSQYVPRVFVVGQGVNTESEFDGLPDGSVVLLNGEPRVKSTVMGGKMPEAAFAGPFTETQTSVEMMAELADMQSDDRAIVLYLGE